MKKLGIAVATVGSFLFSTMVYAQSCPMCKESMTQAGAKLSEGFYLSIMSMFFLPFAIGGTIGAVVFQSWYVRTHPGSELTFPKSFKATLRERRARNA